MMTVDICISFVDSFKINFMKNKLFSLPIFTVLFIVLTPFVAGVFLNFEFVDWGILAITVLWMFILFLPYYFSQKKWVFILSIILPFLMGIIDLSHWIVLYGPMSVVNIFILFETNLSEVGDFLDTYLSFSYVTTMFTYIGFSVFLIVKTRFERRTKRSNIFMGVGILAF
jgi:glucan phosphoethanolaminetransferase (alkaline phosphatase superfamily)